MTKLIYFIIFCIFFVSCQSNPKPNFWIKGVTSDAIRYPAYFIIKGAAIGYNAAEAKIVDSKNDTIHIWLYNDAICTKLIRNQNKEMYWVAFGDKVITVTEGFNDFDDAIDYVVRYNKEESND